MNMLNSILLEGRVVTITKSASADASEPFSLSLVIKTDRFEKCGEGLEKRSFKTPIVAHGNLARNCSEAIKLGQGVRVVGRIWCEADDQMYVIAEHIELKPVRFVEAATDDATETEAEADEAD